MRADRVPGILAIEQPGKSVSLASLVACAPAYRVSGIQGFMFAGKQDIAFAVLSMSYLLHTGVLAIGIA
jgi:hypothetical protein